VYDVERLIT